MDFKKDEVSTSRGFFSIKEEKNQESVTIIVIDIDYENSVGLVIIYEDGYIYFDCLNKNDETLKNENWSIQFSSVEDILTNLSEFLIKKIQ
ncbi:MAG: hypothetical protein EAZ55_14035 [Cytophagales bacterium]|nr:MAG: hypothetical protein EAZ55_14035 [Cytophagales bacterium]